MSVGREGHRSAEVVVARAVEDVAELGPGGLVPGPYLDLAAAAVGLGGTDGDPVPVVGDRNRCAELSAGVGPVDGAAVLVPGAAVPGVGGGRTVGGVCVRGADHDRLAVPGDVDGVAEPVAGVAEGEIAADLVPVGAVPVEDLGEAGVVAGAVVAGRTDDHSGSVLGQGGVVAVFVGVGRPGEGAAEGGCGCVGGLSGRCRCEAGREHSSSGEDDEIAAPQGRCSGSI